MNNQIGLFERESSGKFHAATRKECMRESIYFNCLNYYLSIQKMKQNKTPV